jgi:pSer/pThr/pTyr-binding forkhead associated (FHA) protein
VVGTDTVIDCDLSQNTFTLGRKSDNEDTPHINLTSYNAAELGVSRQHARITRMNAIIMLEDLATTNGTFVNGERISPSKPCVICHEDEIRLGNLKLQVLFD